MDRAWGAALLRELVEVIDDYDDAHDRELWQLHEARILELEPAAVIVLNAASSGLGDRLDDPQIGRWADLRERALAGIGHLTGAMEARERMRPDSPELLADQLHPWVWESARSLWGSAHFAEAVRAAAVRVNAETQSKVHRRDVSESDLFKQVFTLDDPKPDRPRLRVMEDDGSKTVSSLHRGVMAFAEGCYAALRNPGSHDLQTELSEHHALEQLAAFSILARWVDQAEMIVLEEGGLSWA